MNISDLCLTCINLWLRSSSNPIAGMFVTIFEGELGDAGFIKIAQSFGDHPIVLFLGGAGERQLKSEFAREIQCDTAVFHSVCS